MNVNPRPRARLAPAPPAVLCEGMPVVGGPRGINMRLGFPVHSEGRPVNKWPYKADSELIGYRVSDPIKGKAKVHAWKVREGKLRYMGAFPSVDTAVSLIETAWEQSQKSETQEVQRVAVNPPRRRVRA